MTAVGCPLVGSKCATKEPKPRLECDVDCHCHLNKVSIFMYYPDKPMLEFALDTMN